MLLLTRSLAAALLLSAISIAALLANLHTNRFFVAPYNSDLENVISYGAAIFFVATGTIVVSLFWKRAQAMRQYHVLLVGALVACVPALLPHLGYILLSSMWALITGDSRVLIQPMRCALAAVGIWAAAGFAAAFALQVLSSVRSAQNPQA